MACSNVEYIKACLQAGISVLLQGPPGSGKTSISREVAESCGMAHLSIVATVKEPVDFSGLPRFDGDNAVFVPFGFAKRVYNATEPTLVLIDDLGQSAPSVQAAAMQWLQERELNGNQVSEHVRFLIATNRPKDRAGVGQVISPIRSRCVQLEQVTRCTCDGRNLCDWHVWALEHDISPIVQGFARFKPSCMAEYEEENVDHASVVCSPRALEYLSRLEVNGLPEPALPLLEGVIGTSYASDYLAFRVMYGQLPLIDDIVKDPVNTPIPSGSDKVGKLYALSTMLAAQVSAKNASAVLTFVARMPIEYSTACVMTGLRKYPGLPSHREFVDWATQSAPHLLGGDDS